MNLRRSKTIFKINKMKTQLISWVFSNFIKNKFLQKQILLFNYFCTIQQSIFVV